MHNALFLHGGPGLHCAVERAWFGDTVPIQWWNQPAVAKDPAPFRTLVAHAGSELQKLASAGGGQVDLIAHSFGGQIAVALAREHAALIDRITLLGCSPDPINQFLLLARNLLHDGHELPGLRAALAATEESCDVSNFFSLVQACFPNGALPSIYFGPHSADARERYVAIAARTPPMDAATFFAVMQEFLHTPPSAQVTEYDGEVTMLMGTHDPLLDPDEDINKWREVFPQAKLKMVNAGHIVHLELPPEVWREET